MKTTKSDRRTVAVRVIEFTEWIPCYADDKIKMPGTDNQFWLANGVVAAQILEDETLFDVNRDDTGIREEIEISVRGQKQTVMHSLYFFQFIVGRVIDGEPQRGPHHVFKLRPASHILTPNGPPNVGGKPPGGLPGLGGPLRG